MGHYAEAIIDLLSTDKGGRSSSIQLEAKPPDRFRPQFRLANGRCIVVEFFYGDVGLIQPGESSRVGIDITDVVQADRDALQLDTRFDILEGDIVIGTGRIVGRYGTDDSVWKEIAEEQRRRQEDNNSNPTT
jgi:hypothetical protein